MKKKHLLIISLVLLLIICYFSLLSQNIKVYMDNLWAKDYFGGNYREILHYTSHNDKKISDNIMNHIDEAFNYIGTDEDAENLYGELSGYCGSATNVERYCLKFVTANFNDTDGYLWFIYYNNTSSNVLTRLTLKKIKNEWVVTNSKEHP